MKKTVLILLLVILIGTACVPAATPPKTPEPTFILEEIPIPTPTEIPKGYLAAIKDGDAFIPLHTELTYTDGMEPMILGEESFEQAPTIDYHPELEFVFEEDVKVHGISIGEIYRNEVPELPDNLPAGTYRGMVHISQKKGTYEAVFNLRVEGENSDALLLLYSPEEILIPNTVPFDASRFDWRDYRYRKTKNLLPVEEVMKLAENSVTIDPAQQFVEVYPEENYYDYGMIIYDENGNLVEEAYVPIGHWDVEMQGPGKYLLVRYFCRQVDNNIDDGHAAAYWAIIPEESE